MNTSNDSSKLALDLGGDATCTGRVLRDDELENVSGGRTGMHLEDVSLAFSIDIGTSENLVVNASSGWRRS